MANEAFEQQARLDAAEQLRQLKEAQKQVEQQAKAEAEIARAIEAATKAGANLSGSILTLAMAKSQPQIVKQLISTNFKAKVPTSANRMKIAKQQRYNQAVSRFKNSTVSPQLVTPPPVPPTQLGPISKASLALGNILSGQDVGLNSDIGNQFSILDNSQRQFIKFLLEFLEKGDKANAMRIYAAYHFNDHTIFDKHPEIQDSLMKGYNEFINLVQTTAAKAKSQQTNQSNTQS
jgi:hypothetical protein